MSIDIDVHSVVPVQLKTIGNTTEEKETPPKRLFLAIFVYIYIYNIYIYIYIYVSLVMEPVFAKSCKQS